MLVAASTHVSSSNTAAAATAAAAACQVWSLGQPLPNFTLEGHEKGVNCVDYFTGGKGWIAAALPF
jgi:coatomer subunit beta'